jgi:hypothetical protein
MDIICYACNHWFYGSKPKSARNSPFIEVSEVELAAKWSPPPDSELDLSPDRSKFKLIACPHCGALKLLPTAPGMDQW